MCGTIALHQLNWVLRLMAMPKSHFASVMSTRFSYGSRGPTSAMPRIVDEDVDVAMLRQRFLDDARDRRPIGQIGLMCGDRDTPRPASSRGALVHLLVDVGDGEGRALLAENLGRGEANAVGVGHASDEGDLALQPARAHDAPPVRRGAAAGAAKRPPRPPRLTLRSLPRPPHACAGRRAR